MYIQYFCKFLCPLVHEIFWYYYKQKENNNKVYTDHQAYPKIHTLQPFKIIKTHVQPWQHITEGLRVFNPTKELSPRTKDSYFRISFFPAVLLSW